MLSKKKSFYKKIKKIVCVMMASLMCFGITSCKGNEEGTPSITIQESNVSLVENGTSRYQIVLPEAPEEQENFAAQELQDIFYQSSGVVLPILSDVDAQMDFSQYYISIGETALKEMANISVEDMNSSGFKLQRKDNTLLIVGKTAYGSLYGVYEFLERNLGYKAYAPDEISVDNIYNKKLLDFDYSYEPPIAGRNMANYLDRISGVNERFKINNASLALGWPHSFNYTVSPSEYPSFYKSGNTTTLCLTDQAMWEVAYNNILENFISSPSLEFYCFAQEDIRGKCSCAECQESYEVYGYTGTYMLVGNYLARRLREYFAINDPGRSVNILLLAYFDSQTAPVKTEKVNGEEVISPIAPEVTAESNVWVEVCLTGQDFAASIYSSANSASYSLLKNWALIAPNRLLCYIYDGWGMHYSMHYVFDWEYQQDTIKALTEFGIQQVWWEQSNETFFSFRELRLYYTSNLLFNPNQDSNKLISDFMTNYYKEAGPYMQEYFDTLNLNFKKAQFIAAENNNIITQQCWPYMNRYLLSKDVWPQLMLEQLIDLLDEGIKAIEESNAYDNLRKTQLIERVRKEQIFPRYYQLLIYKNTFDTEVYNEMVEEFNADVAEFGGTTFIS